ncbi:phosphatidate cytidylyltransferase [Candidatus Nitrospira bockiana]
MAAVAPSPPRRLDRRRVYAALVFIPLFYLIVRYLPPVALFALIASVALMALLEFYRLYFGTRQATTAVILGLGLAALLLTQFQWPSLLPAWGLSFLIVAAVLIFYVTTVRDLRHSFTDIAVIITGIFYVAFTLGHILLTRALPEGVALTFFLVLVTWAADTGAYYAGVTLGRTKLAPLLSPNKTVEGLLGGVLLAIAAALVARAWFLPSFTPWDAVTLGIVLTLAGLFGDLSESLLKRSAGVKDSGGLIPGHGGMLDRLDSLLFTAPTFYYYVALLKG